MRAAFLLFVLALAALGAALLPGPLPAAGSVVEVDTVTAGIAPGSQAISGDVDGNGEVNSIDAFHLLQHDAGIIWPNPNEELYKIADLNEDGLLNSLDATLILQFHAGLIDNLNPPTSM